MNRDAVIVSAVRTPIARRAGALAEFPLHQYGAIVMKEAMDRAGVKAEMIDDVIMGNVLSGGGNIARLTALETGLSLNIAGMTIDRQCGSGISAIHIVAQAINAGDGDVYIAGGLESYSQAPFLMKRPTRAYPMKPPEFQKRFPRRDRKSADGHNR